MRAFILFTIIAIVLLGIVYAEDENPAEELVRNKRQFGFGRGFGGGFGRGFGGGFGRPFGGGGFGSPYGGYGGYGGGFGSPYGGYGGGFGRPGFGGFYG